MAAIFKDGGRTLRDYRLFQFCLLQSVNPVNVGELEQFNDLFIFLCDIRRPSAALFIILIAGSTTALRLRNYFHAQKTLEK